MSCSRLAFFLPLFLVIACFLTLSFAFLKSLLLSNEVLNTEIALLRKKGPYFSFSYYSPSPSSLSPFRSKPDSFLLNVGLSCGVLAHRRGRNRPISLKGDRGVETFHAVVQGNSRFLKRVFGHRYIYKSVISLIREREREREKREMTRNKNKKKVRWIKHYNSGQKILLVGEGDFSFSACLATAFGSGRNMVATSLHAQELQKKKHRSSEEQLEKLERLGCQVLHEVDVYEMNHHPTLQDIKFDVVVFNFPHAGHFHGYKEKDKDLIELHKNLLRGFFKSAREMLVKEGGEVHVTHRDDYPYKKWKLEKLAKGSGFNLKEKERFQKGDYPGYHNKRGGDINCNRTFPIKNDCFTFKFSLHETNIGCASGDDRGLGGIIAAVEDLHV